MKQCDTKTIEHFGVPSLVLMERAALAVADAIRQEFPDPTARILVVCGSGNNGGDGYAVARLLFLAGYPVDILSAMPQDRRTAETKTQAAVAANYGIPVFSEYPKQEAYAVIVDALFGIGLSREIRGGLAELLQQLNDSPSYRVAVDIPSGVSADTGEIFGVAFQADLTVTFGFAKTGLYVYPGAGYCGKVRVCEMGIDAHSLPEAKIPGQYLEEADLHRLLPTRTDRSNKGTYGKVLVIAGSAEMSGAAYFSAKAAYYSGCGLVKILTPKQNRVILAEQLPEALITTYDTEEADMETVTEAAAWADAVLIGPGIGTEAVSTQILSQVLTACHVPLVLDADALNLLAQDGHAAEKIASHPSKTVVTPHPGEMGRLTGKATGEVTSHLLETALAFAKKAKTVCVLKDARTVTAAPDGRYSVNLTGNHGMATGGSGDVLAGFLTGLLAQGMPEFEAAQTACFLHGLAGDLAKERKGARGMIAGDILEMLPDALMHTGEEGWKENAGI